MKNYQWLARVLFGVAIGAFAGLSSAATTTYFHNDLAGSPVAATDSSGQVLWRESYRPYGERLKLEPASVNNSIWFTGRHEDAHTELVYMGARYYDPRIGRFLSTDPVYLTESNVHSFNRYAYANNNPSKYADPDGRAAETIFDIASFALSVAIFRKDPSLLNFGGAVVDGAAIAIPFVPGGVGAIRTAMGGVEEMAKGVSKWGNMDTLPKHFREHGNDFGAKSADDYAQQASDFLRRSQAERLPTKIDEGGVIRVYDPKSNSFGAFNPDGTTRTYFKPTSPNYFDRQPGSSQ